MFVYFSLGQSMRLVNSRKINSKSAEIENCYCMCKKKKWDNFDIIQFIKEEEKNMINLYGSDQWIIDKTRTTYCNSKLFFFCVK